MNIPQILANSLIRASELGLLAVGLTTVFGILKFSNFAHADYAVFGAFLAYTLNVTLGLNLFLSVLLGALVTGVFSVGIDKIIFKPLRMRGANTVTAVVTSLGIAIALRNIIRMIWTSDSKTYAIPIERPISILGARVTHLQIEIIIVGLVAMIAFHLLLQKTKFGKALRAISDNQMLARACSIDSEKMIQWMWFLASGFGVIGGTMIAMEHLLYPRLGFDVLIPVFCVTILGGIGNPYGAVLGAFILALSENVILALKFGSVQISTGYKPAISFVILIIVLLIRPTGILRRK